MIAENFGVQSQPKRPPTFREMALKLYPGQCGRISFALSPNGSFFGKILGPLLLEHTLLNIRVRRLPSNLGLQN